jgi:peptide/nickel transport system substrate-binding protein
MNRVDRNKNSVRTKSLRASPGVIGWSRCAAIAFGCLLATLLCCTDMAMAQKTGGVLRVFHSDSPTSTSIHEEYNAATVLPFMPVFNNLVAFDPGVPQNSDASIVPDLAESWSWNDDKTELTFKLRQGVKWHDGWPFTSGDVECTFNLLTGRARDRLRSNPRAAWYRNISYVHGSTDYEVTLHLNHPQPSLLSLLASGLTPIYPCHVPSAQMRIKPIGTGPFKVDSFKQFDSLRLVRNPDYFKPGRPYLDGIELSIVPSQSTAMLSFVAGRFDLTFPWEVPITQLRDIRRQSPRIVCETTSMNNNTNILVNRDAPPFDNPDVRRALILALDRKAFIATLNEGDGQVGGVMQPPPDGKWGMPEERLATVPGYGPDIEKNRAEARALMGLAGFTPQKRLLTKIATRPLSAYRNPATLLADQLRAINIDAELDVIENSQWHPRLERRQYTIGINNTGNGVDDPDQGFFENFSCRSERNYNGYCNGEIERLFERQSVETDPAKRRQLVWDIDSKLLADAARPVIMWNRNATCWQPYVKGYVPHVNSTFNGSRFEDVWLER